MRPLLILPRSLLHHRRYHGLNSPLLRRPTLAVPCPPPLRTPFSSTSLARIGQPTHKTHPHLLASGELTPGIKPLEYSLRRAQLAASLPDGAVAIIPSATVKYRSGPVFYEFHQNSDFFYLTGFLEPDAVAVIEKTGPEKEHLFHLFVRERDAHAELWNGARTGVEGAVEVFNAEMAYDIENLQYHISPLLEHATVVFADVPSQQDAASSAHQMFFGASRGTTLTAAVEGKRTQPLRPTMDSLRLFKTEAEVGVMRTAGKISGRAYNGAMGEQFSTEKELYSFLEYEFRRGGCDGSAYVPVVAGGKNALTIHYTSNNSILRDGDLILVDAGGHHGGYVTDITRTWPVNGKFSPPQYDLYSAVLTVQRNCIKLCRQSAELSLDDIHRIASEDLHKELRQLGLDLSNGALSSILFPHHVGHYVGIDLHDCSSYGHSRVLEAGNVVTIEPGVYVPDNPRWPKHFRGMGIRIEDTVYVGEQHPVVLSVEAVKEIADIEALRGS